MAKTHTVQAVAELSGVTVRTLHHYDEIGLLCPRRSKAGYRQYSDADVLRLQQILVYRALSMPLQRIKALMDDPDFDALAALEEQRGELVSRAADTAAMLRAVDEALARLRGEGSADLRAMFDGFDPAAYEQETEARWGHTEAYAQSKSRTATYSPEQWAAIRSESAAILRRVAEAIDAAVLPESPQGAALADAYRLHIDRYFYACSPAMYRQVAAMYPQDDRFRETLDRAGSGVATFLAVAAKANADADAGPRVL